MGYLVVSNLSYLVEETRCERRNSEDGVFRLFRRMEREVVVVVVKWVVPLIQ
jgi:hypothetical protein